MKKTFLGAGVLLVLVAGTALAQTGGTSQTQDEQNMTAGAAVHGTPTAYQQKLQDAYNDFNGEHFDKATAELKDIIKKEPNNLMAHQMLAAIYQKQNKVAEMVPELETVTRLAPKDTNAQNNLGVAYLQTGQFDKAATIFKAAQARSPKDPATAYYLGLALAQSGKAADAVPVLQTAVKLKPSSAAYIQLGAAYSQLGKADEAATAFQSASALNPKDPEAVLDAGMLYHQSGHDDKAIPALQKAIALGTRNKFGAHMVLAEAYGKAGKTGDAIQEYKLASAAKPDDFGAVADMGVLSQNEGKKPEAIAAYRQALTLKAASPEALAQVQGSLAGLLAQDATADHTTEAVTLLTQAAQNDPKNVQYVSDLGQVYEKQGKTDLATAAYQKALTLDAHQSEATQGLARLKLKK